MPAFKAIIKGNAAEVIKAAEDRGLKIAYIQKHPSYDECVGIIAGQTDKVVSWFCEGNKFEAPYPAGSLMWYGLESVWPQGRYP